MNQSAATLPAAPECALAREIDELPLPYIEIDAQGLITRANRVALALHHPEQGELIGKCAWDTMAVDEKDFSSAAFLAHMESGEEPHVATRSLFDRSGSFRTYQLHRSLIRDAAGRPAGMRIVGVDITETTKALEEARRARQWLESAMISLAEAVILTDSLGVVRSVNPAAEELSGWCACGLIGKTIDELLPTQAFPPGGGAFLDLHALLDRPCKGNAFLVTRDRKEIRVEISTSPILHQESGSIIGITALLRKI